MATGTLDVINASASPETQMNEALIALKPAGLFGQRGSTTAGLVFGYYGGAIGGGGGAASFSFIADGTVTLTASTTNYIEATAAGVVSKNTVGFTAGSIPLYTAVTSATGITTLTDYRVMGNNMGPRYVDNETPGGTVNGSNAAFTLAKTPSPATSLLLFNGPLLQRYGIDYTLSGLNITFIPAAIPQSDFGSPAAIDILSAYYRY